MEVHQLIFIKFQRKNTPSGLLIPIPNATYSPTNTHKLVRQRYLFIRGREGGGSGDVRGTHCSNNNL
jgi:hypothetical protein